VFASKVKVYEISNQDLSLLKEHADWGYDREEHQGVQCHDARRHRQQAKKELRAR
jgi:hypothetical protein